MADPAPRSLLAAARNSFRPAYARELARKAANRVLERRHQARGPEAVAWASERAVDAAALADDAATWVEAQEVAARIEAEAAVALSNVATVFGGGAHIALLYYLVRTRRPAVVVETGVAAGWSSRAVLEALEANGSGHLWSSDLPYLGQAAAPDEIGCLVPPPLRHRWDLRLDGDRKNLPAILEECGPIDLFHYDSDKTYRGRQWALAAVGPRLAPGAAVVMDDIHENLCFADYVTGRPDDRHHVVVIRNHFLGIVFDS